MTPEPERAPANRGNALLDRAARLLSAKYHVVREARARGAGTDLYCEENLLGRSIRILVEAKDFDRGLNREQVLRIWTDYKSVLDRSYPAHPTFLLLLTRHGLTPDAYAFVQLQAGILHQTIEELEEAITRDLENSTSQTFSTAARSLSLPDLAPPYMAPTSPGLADGRAKARGMGEIELIAIASFASALLLSLLHDMGAYFGLEFGEFIGDTAERVWGTLALLLLVVAIVSAMAWTAESRSPRETP